MSKLCVGVFGGLVLIYSLMASASACCVPCHSICDVGVSADTVCCSGDPAACDGCGQTTCGACAIQSTLDKSCAKTCNGMFAQCSEDGPSGCYADWGVCFDSCWTEKLVCEHPPCASECTADAYEPNDSLAAAQSSNPIYGPKTVVIADLMAEPFDEDYFSAYADCCNTAWVAITWDPALGQLDLQMLDAEGNAFAPGDPGFKKLSKPGFLGVRKKSHGGAFYFRVSHLEGDCIPYTAKVYSKVYL